MSVQLEGVRLDVRARVELLVRVELGNGSLLSHLLSLLLRVGLLQSKLMLLLKSSELSVKVVLERKGVSTMPARSSSQLGQILRRILGGSVFGSVGRAGMMTVAASVSSRSGASQASMRMPARPVSRRQTVWARLGLLGDLQAFSVRLVAILVTAGRGDEVGRVGECTRGNRGVVGSSGLSRGDGVDNLSASGSRNARQTPSFSLVAEAISTSKVVVVGRAGGAASIAFSCSGDLSVSQLVLGSSEGFMSLKLIQLIRGGRRKSGDVVHARRVARNAERAQGGVRVGVFWTVKVHVVRRVEMWDMVRSVVIVIVVGRGVPSALGSAVLVGRREMDSSMSGQLVGSRESLVAAGVSACVGFLARVSSNVTSLTSANFPRR